MVENATQPASASPAVHSVAALLALGDADFVRAAYRSLLGRDADESGLAAYTALIRDGEEKARIVATLALSDEGRQRPQTLPGLDQLLAAQAPRQDPWLTRALRRLLRPLHSPSQAPVERALRAIDNRLYRIEAAVQTQAAVAEQLRGDLGLLAISIDTLKSGFAEAGRTGPAQTSRQHPHAPSARPQDDMPRQVPPRVEQVLRGLQRMLALRRGDPH